MDASKKIRVALDGWEGDVLTCYLDPVGIPTIGKGFTNRSKVLTEMLGKLKPGVTKITKEQSDKIFSVMLDKEYEPMVNMPGARQHEFDVGVSTVWNLGPKSQGWKWARLWRDGRKQAAADYLGSNYNTAAGKKLPGLVRRRREEAEILRTGTYPQDVRAGRQTAAPEGIQRIEQPSTPVGPDPVTQEAQEALNKLGAGKGLKVDGWYGPKTRAAVLTYQKAHPHLVNDGKLGPATLAQLRRDLMAMKKTFSETTVVSAGAGGISYLTGLPWGWFAVGAGVVVVIYLAWQYRDVIQRRFNSMFNITKEV
jgi:GH24 family phage-related lysozyme (muramidase)